MRRRLAHRLSAFVCFVCFAVSSPRAAEVEFVRVQPQWHNADVFERIGEFFGQGERHTSRIVERTQAGVRDGYYFLVRVKAATAPAAGAKFVLQIIRPNTPVVKEFTFPATAARAGETVFQLGLTGSDWPGGKDASPVAWKLALFAADGRVLAEQKSFLWELPPK